MLKNILNLEGAQKLSNNEQKSINGGRKQCVGPDGLCKEYGLQCAEFICRFIEP